MVESMLRAASLIDPLVQANFHIESSIKHTYPLHYHDYYEIFIITIGNCIHKINSQDQYLEKGAMVFIRPEDRHSYDFYDSTDCQFININFYKEMVEDAFGYFGNHIFTQKLKNLELSPYVVLPTTDMEGIIKKSEQIHLYSTIDKIKAKILAKSLIIDALTYYFLNHQNENKKQIPFWFDSLLFQMQKKENFTVGLEKLYSISNRSVGHLNRIFKQYLSTTPTTYINHLKLRYARNLLLTTDLTILEISFEAGFENLSHFYHLFRESFGVSPGKIRCK
jgi:AraC family transcriptional regulator, dual regulator of chb operon